MALERLPTAVRATCAPQVPRQSDGSMRPRQYHITSAHRAHSHDRELGVHGEAASAGVPQRSENPDPFGGEDATSRPHASSSAQLGRQTDGRAPLAQRCRREPQEELGCEGCVADEVGTGDKPPENGHPDVVGHLHQGRRVAGDAGQGRRRPCRGSERPRCGDLALRALPRVQNLRGGVGDTHLLSDWALAAWLWTRGAARAPELASA